MINRITERLKECPWCQKPLRTAKDQWCHLEKHGCPIMRRALDAKAAPYCKCGCGSRVEESKRKPGTFNAFIRGHNKKAK